MFAIKKMKMKNLFLFLAITFAITLNSCSGEDSGFSSSGPGEGTITATFDGSVKSFSSVFVSQQSVGSDIVLTVTATAGTATPEIFAFKLNKGQTGANAITVFNYSKGGISYATSFTTLISINNENHLKGTFSGTITGENAPIAITDGSFDISY